MEKQKGIEWGIVMNCIDQWESEIAQGKTPTNFNTFAALVSSNLFAAISKFNEICEHQDEQIYTIQAKRNI